MLHDIKMRSPAGGTTSTQSFAKTCVSTSRNLFNRSQDQPVLLRAMRDAEEISSREFRKRVLDICSSSLHLTAERLPCTMQLPNKSKTRNDLQAKCPQSTRMVCLHAQDVAASLRHLISFYPSSPDSMLHDIKMRSPAGGTTSTQSSGKTVSKVHRSKNIQKPFSDE